MSGERMLHQVALGATDLERSIAFYGDTLGLREIARFDPPGLAFFDLDGTRLLLERCETAAPGHGVLYLRVDDLDREVAALEARGVRFTSQPHRIHRDDAGTFGPVGREEWMAFFDDPDGNTLALVGLRSGD